MADAGASEITEKVFQKRQTGSKPSDAEIYGAFCRTRNGFAVFRLMASSMLQNSSGNSYELLLLSKMEAPLIEEQHEALAGHPRC